MVQKNSKLIIIAGPTCSGKSGLALDLAKRINGAIISVDSMQIYKEMNIGTAKTLPSEFAGIPYYLTDIVSPSESFSVAEYKLLADKAIDEIISLKKYPIAVGGTGLYINSLIYPMSFGKSEKNEELRNKLNLELSEYGAEFIHNKLRALDPVSAERLHKNDTRRVIRAIEIAQDGKNTMTENKDEMSPIRDYIMIGLDIPREILYMKINERVEIMFNNGLLGEVEALRNKYSFDYQAMQAIGYKEFINYFEGKSDINSVKELIKKNTRNYAKRQMTWLRKYDKIKWFNPLKDYDNAIEYIMRNI